MPPGPVGKRRPGGRSVPTVLASSGIGSGRSGSGTGSSDGRSSSRAGGRARGVGRARGASSSGIGSSSSGPKSSSASGIGSGMSSASPTSRAALRVTSCPASRTAGSSTDDGTRGMLSGSRVETLGATGLSSMYRTGTRVDGGGPSSGVGSSGIYYGDFHYAGRDRKLR